MKFLFETLFLLSAAFKYVLSDGCEVVTTDPNHFRIVCGIPNINQESIFENLRRNHFQCDLQNADLWIVCGDGALANYIQYGGRNGHHFYCSNVDDDAFGSSANDPFGDDNEEDSFGFDDEESEESIEALGDEITDEEFKPPKDSEWEAQVKPKAEFVDCQCEWGLFRDRNVTMREPIRLHSGVNDLNKKGIGKVQL